MGSKVGHSGSEVESLFKNLQQVYQQEKQRLHVSGIETFVSSIRNSAELYVAFDSYYQLFNPKGGSAMPAMVMTEQSVVYMSKKLVHCFFINIRMKM